jgi:hypothetical protein
LLVWGEYSVELGFDSVWVGQIDGVVRIKP